MKTIRVKPTTPDLVILALLSERPMHGYEIIQELNYRDAKDWVEISKPQIYYSLEKLHRNKFIALASDQEAPSGPDRQTFKITALGKTSLNERLKSVTWTNQRPPTPFQTWMALSSQLSKAERKTMLAARLVFVEKQLTKERETLKAILKDQGSMVEVAARMVDLFIRQAEVEHRWLSEILNGMKSKITGNNDRN